MQIDWLNKFIFDMWPFLDKVLSTFTWPIWYKFSALFTATSLWCCTNSRNEAWLSKIMFFAFLAQAICNNIKRATRPIFDQYVGKYGIESIEYEQLTLGSLPPTFQGL